VVGEGGIDADPLAVDSLSRSGFPRAEEGDSGRLLGESDEQRAAAAELSAEVETAGAARDRAEAALKEIAEGTRYDGRNHVNVGRRELMRMAARALEEEAG
jgi:hypothetical protein